MSVYIPGVDFDGDVGHDKITERSGTEFVACRLPLFPPHVAVGVENPAAEKILEDRDEALAFRETLEFRLEDVLDVRWVRRHDELLFPWSPENRRLGWALG